MKTVYIMLEEALKASGHGGLFNSDSECSCAPDDLAPCGAMQMDCQAGYKHTNNNGDFCITNSAEPMTDEEIGNFL